MSETQLSQSKISKSKKEHLDIINQMPSVFSVQSTIGDKQKFEDLYQKISKIMKGTKLNRGDILKEAIHLLESKYSK